jgi:arsenate reductase
MVPPEGIRRGRPPMRGSSRLSRPDPVGNPQQSEISRRFSKPKVLFVCIGNSCRSQMAEAFARAYGADVMIARSAGIAPATSIAPMTREVVAQRNIRMDDHFPKAFEMAMLEQPDLVVNMSGSPLATGLARVIEWPVQDPIGQREEVYRSVAAQIEGLVMRLVLELRNGGL